jgi:hypothetical protein
MWHARVIFNDRTLTAAALRLAGAVFDDYGVGVGKPVKLSLKKTAEALGIDRRTMIRARDQLVAHGWLIRLNDGSKCTALYDLGPGPGVSAVTPSTVSAVTLHPSYESYTSTDSQKQRLGSLVVAEKVKERVARKRKTRLTIVAAGEPAAISLRLPPPMTVVDDDDSSPF